MKVATETVQTQDRWVKPAEFTLPAGLIGFPEARRIELLYNPEELPLMWLRSVDNPSLNFIVIDPVGTIPGYTLEISDEDAETLGIRSPDEAIVLNIVTMKSSDPAEATVNLIGPIVINRETLIGRQIIIANFADYSARHPLLQTQPSES